MPGNSNLGLFCLPALYYKPFLTQGGVQKVVINVSNNVELYLSISGQVDRKKRSNLINVSLKQPWFGCHFGVHPATSGRESKGEYCLQVWGVFPKPPSVSECIFRLMSSKERNRCSLVGVGISLFSRMARQIVPDSCRTAQGRLRVGKNPRDHSQSLNCGTFLG